MFNAALGLGDTHIRVRAREGDWIEDGVQLGGQDEQWQLHQDLEDRERLFLRSPARQGGLPTFFGEAARVAWMSEQRIAAGGAPGATEVHGFMVRFGGAAQGLVTNDLVLVIDIFDEERNEDSGCAVVTLEQGQDRELWTQWLSRVRRRDRQRNDQ